MYFGMTQHDSSSLNLSIIIIVIVITIIIHPTNFSIEIGVLVALIISCIETRFLQYLKATAGTTD